jgi:DNA repair exonuclease SbcCD ATPase subunit
MEQLFSQFADLPKLKKEQGDVLQLFKEVEEQIKRLSEAGLLIDGAKNLGQLSRYMKEFDSVLDKGAVAMDKVGAAIQKNSKFTQADIEAIKKAKGVTDEYVASLVKLAQSKQVYAEGHKKAGQQREKPMSGFQMYMGENMKAGSGKSHTQVSDEWTALDEQMKSLWNYAAQFTKFGAVAEGVGAALDSAAQHAKEHAQESKAATSDVKAHTEALKDNTDAAGDNAEAADKWAKAIEAQKARAAQLVAGVSTEPAITTFNDSLGENATQRDNLKAQLDGIRQAKKELSQLNQREFAGQFTEDINALAEAEERLKIQIQQANRFVANQARELQAQGGSLDEMRAKLNQMLQTYDAMGDAGKGTEGGRALKQQINDITVAIKEGEEGTDRYFRSVGKYAETLRPLFDKVGAQIEKLKAEQKELQAQGNGGVQNLTGPRPQVGFQIGAGEGPERLNQVTSQLQALETIQQAAAKSTGSYAQQVRVLDSALDEMARSGGSSVGFVLEMKEALQDAKIQNLGNFEGSAKIIVQAFEEARVKVRRFTQEMGESHPETVKAKEELAALSRVVESPQFLNVAGKVGDAVSEVRYFTKALVDLEAQGMGNSQAANELRQRLALLTDEIADVRSEVKAMSSDTRAFDLWASSIGSLASVFQTAAAGSELLAGESEQVQKSIAKLMAIQNVANGIRSIANDLTTKGSAANKAYAWAQGQVAVMTNASTTATNKFKAALALSGIGLLIIALGYAAQKMGLFGSATDDTEKEIEELNAALERQNSLLDDNNRKVDTATRLRVLKLKEQGKSETQITAVTVAGLAKQAAAHENQARRVTASIQKILTAYGLQVSDYESAQRAMEFAQGRGDKALETSLGNVVENYKKAGELRNQVLFANKENRVRLANEERQLDKKSADDRKKALDEEKKAQLELLKFRLELEADKAGAFSDIGSNESIRVEQAKQEAAIRKQIVIAQRNFDLSQEGVTATERVLIREKAAADITAIEAGLGAKIIQIRQDIAQGEQDLIAQTTAWAEQQMEAGLQKQVDASTRSHEKRLLNIEQMALLDQKAARENYEKGLITQEEYTLQSEQIETDKQRKILESQIKFYEDQVAILAAAGKDVLAMEQALAQARAALFNLDTGESDKGHDKQKQKVEELKAKYRELGEEIKGAFEALLLGNADRDQARIQEQMDNLDKRKAKEIEVVNSSIMSEEKKAEEINRIEARAQSQREALERRQRQIEAEKARFQRAMQIASVVANTAEGVTAALTSKPPNVPLSIVVGAIGAASLVKILATPIPGYWTGVDHAPEGYAQVAEKGRELAVDPSGQMVMYEKPTVTYLKEGTTIYNNQETERIIRESHSAPLVGKDYEPFQKEKTKAILQRYQLTSELRRVIENSYGPKEPARERQGDSAVLHQRNFLQQYLKEPLITPEQVRVDMAMASQREVRVLMSQPIQDKSGAELKQLRADFAEAVAELGLIKKLLKDIRSNSRINIYNEHGVESRAEFPRLMKR